MKICSSSFVKLKLKFTIFYKTGLDQFVEPLRSTCTLKVKPNSVKQEYEKQDELKRSALRAVAALLQIPKAGMFRSLCFRSLSSLHFH